MRLAVGRERSGYGGGSYLFLLTLQKIFPICDLVASVPRQTLVHVRRFGRPHVEPGEIRVPLIE